MTDLNSPVPILFWMNTPSFGGTERMNLRIIERLDRSEFAVDLLFFSAAKPDLMEGFRRAARRVYFADELGFFKTAALLRKYPLIYAFGLKGNLCARLQKILKPSTRILSSLHSVIPHTNLESRLPILLDKLTWRLADQYVSNSCSGPRYLQERYGYPARFRAIEHGLALEEFDSAPVKFSLKERFKLPASARILSTVGSFNHIKNHRMLLESLAVLGRNDVFTFCVGKGPQKAELIELARTLGLSERVWFLSDEPEVISFLKASDSFVSTSRVEGLPGAVMEAMACGAAVVATDVYGNDQLVTNEKTGLAVPLGDACAFASAVARVLDDPALRQRLAAAARLLIEERFTLDRTVTQTAELFREVLRPVKK